MASPSMPKSTRINRAIRTIAWPCCRLALRGSSLVGVFSTVDRICSDDDVAANCLLYQWGDRLERVPDRYLDRLRADRDTGALVGRLLQRDVQVQRAAEVDDAESQQQDDRRDDRELGQALRPLTAEVSLQSLSHGLPWIVKCSL